MIKILRAVTLALTAWPFAITGAIAETMPVDGAELPYVSAGEGTPVVFVHGAISDHRVWLPVKDAIAAERRFVAYDQRYFGTAAWPDDGANFSADNHATDLIAFVEHLDAGPVYLVTWSYSGDVGSHFALKRPDLVRAMVHFEPAVGSLMTGLPGAERVTNDMFAKFGPAMEAMKDGRLEDSSLRFLDAVFELPVGSADKEPEPWPTIWRQNGRTIPLFLKGRGGDVVTCDALGELRIPTLVIVGANSHPRYAMMSERLAACQPNAVLVTMDDVNHDGPYRRPGELAEMIDSFLDLVE